MSRVNSLNRRALQVVEEMASKLDELGIVELSVAGARVIDCGVNARGSFEAGLYVARVCLADLAKLEVSVLDLQDLALPRLVVATDRPVEACMLSQYAGWKLNIEGYTAMSSGPARILAKKPKKLYEEFQVPEASHEGVLVIEAARLPSEGVVRHVAQACSTSPSDLTLLAFSTSSIVNSVQLSARSVETAIHKMHMLGLPLKHFKHGVGSCPVAPMHPDPTVTMGRANDAILLACQVFLAVEYDDLSQLEDIVKNTPSCSSKLYGKPFSQIFREAQCDFYKIDPHLFSPAHVTTLEVKSGKVLRAGRSNYELLKRFLDVQS